MTASKPRIAILLPDLRPGGAERLHVNLAKDWCARGIDVEFVLRRPVGELLRAIPAQATIVDLSAMRVRNVIWPLRRYLKARRPDALLAAMWPLTVVAPLVAKIAGFSGRVVVSEHAPLSIAYSRKGRLHNFVMAMSMTLGYRLADARVAVSSGVAEDIARLAAIGRNDVAVVHNPAATGRRVVPSPDSRPIPSTLGPLIVTVATLKPVKRHDLLIRAFAMLRLPRARLCIIGEGSERHRLEALAEELGIASQVLLLGFETDPTRWYSHADVFVLSSDYEGFGNVLVEALEQGAPIVSTDCPVGPREILEDGRHGILVPVGNVEALASAIQSALSTEHDRGALMRRAADFSLEKASAAYLDLLLPGWRTEQA